MRTVATFVCLALLCGASFAQRTPGQEALAYSLENRVGLGEAANAIGADWSVVGNDLGFPGPLGIWEALMDASLLQATCWRFMPRLSGTAAGTVGLSESRVEALFRLRMANDASFLSECPDNGSPPQVFLLFVMHVWTVGDSYPVAYLFDLEANIYPTYPGRPTDPVNYQWLDYANATQIEGQLREVLAAAVEDFALRFLSIARYR